VLVTLNCTSWGKQDLACFGNLELQEGGCKLPENLFPFFLQATPATSVLIIVVFAKSFRLQE